MRTDDTQYTNPRPEKKYHEIYPYDDYCVIDLETTGFSSYTSEIIELAACKVKNGIVVDQFSTLVKPKHPIPESATRINGITDEMVATAPSIEDALPKYLDFIGDLPVVGHNISSFDTTFLYTFGVKILNRPFTNCICDTLYLSRDVNHDMPAHTLASMCEYYHIENDSAHRALSDVLANQKLYEILKKSICKGYYGFYADAVDCIFGRDISAEDVIARIKEILTPEEWQLTHRSVLFGESVYLFGTRAFGIRITSKIRCIETTIDEVASYMSKIHGMKKLKNGVYRIPLNLPSSDYEAFCDMMKAIYDYCEDNSNDSVMGCCNDFIRCSDAKTCLHKDDPDYHGCYYRKNLEAGHIFYGINKNI